MHIKTIYQFVYNNFLINNGGVSQNIYRVVIMCLFLKFVVNLKS